MNEWPEGRNGSNRGSGYGRGSANEEPEGARVMRQVRRGPAGASPQGAQGAVPPQQSYDAGYGARQSYDSGYNTGQVYGTPSGPGGPYTCPVL